MKHSGKFWSDPPQAFPKVPKVREYAQVTMTDGTRMMGYVFVEATMRIQDLLNGPAQFIPFIDEDDTILLLNKAAIAQVRPYDA
jgi:hypothetical protein